MCRFHGENKAVRAAAEARVQQAEARKVLDRLEGTRWEDYAPHQDFAAELTDVFIAKSARVRWLTQLVGSPGHQDIYGTAMGPKVSPYWEMLRDEEAAVERLMVSMHRMGIAEREIRLAEAQAGQVVAVVQVLLDGLGLTAEQAAKVPDLIRAAVTQVRALTGGDGS